jgi:hypothetical protein
VDEDVDPERQAQERMRQAPIEGFPVNAVLTIARP